MIKRLAEQLRQLKADEEAKNKADPFRKFWSLFYRGPKGRRIQ